MHPISFGQFQSAEMETLLARVIVEFQPDIVHFGVVHLIDFRSVCEKYGVATVLGAYNAFSLGSIRNYKVLGLNSPLSKAKHKYLYKSFNQIERREFPKFSTVFTVAETDTAWLNRQTPCLDAETVGIVVPAEMISNLSYQCRSRTENLHIVCMGYFIHEGIAQGAIEFIEHSWPLVTQKSPGSELFVWSSSGFTRKLKRRIEHNHSIKPMNWVPDYLDALDRTDIMIFPQQCDSGIQVKVQESLARGNAVVTTTTVAQGLGISGGIHALVCDSPKRMGPAVLELIANPSLRMQLGLQAREFIMQTFSQDRITRDLNRIYLKAFDREMLRRAAHTQQADYDDI